MNSYVLGNQVRLSGAFTASGVATDPTTVTLRVKNQTGLNVYTYGAGPSIVKDAVGNYHLDLTINVTGDWYYRWEGTGAVIAADEGHFLVNPSNF